MTAACSDACGGPGCGGVPGLDADPAAGPWDAFPNQSVRIEAVVGAWNGIISDHAMSIAA